MKIFSKIFKIITLLLFILSLYILITKNNPVMNQITKYNDQQDVKIQTLKINNSRFYKNSLMTKNQGIINIKSIYTENGTHLLNDSNTKVLVIKYEFVNNQNKSLRPHETFENNFTALQQNKYLKEGMLLLNNKSNIDESNLENNSVIFLDKGKTVECLNTFAYDPDNGPITIMINGNKIEVNKI